MKQVRRGLVALGLVLALFPLAAQADDGNQAAIDKVRAEKTALDNLPFYEQGVMLGQREITNAHAIARLLSHDAHAQTEIPNSMEQYSAFCSMAIAHIQANLTNAATMASAKPWDQHAQAELANATASMHMLWNVIGDSYPGNPFYVERVADEDTWVASDEDTWVASDEDAELVVADADGQTDAGY